MSSPPATLNGVDLAVVGEFAQQLDADDATLQALHEHVVKTSPVGNTIEHPVEFDARLIRA
jgi:hypothetical protein